jgi:hypothetical protein
MEQKYGRVTNTKMVGTLFSPAQGDEDSRPIQLPQLLERGRHTG